MKKYKIIDVVDIITHNPKSERIGQIVSIMQLDLDHKAVFSYNDSNHMGFITSLVKYIEHKYTIADGETYIIETENSIYYLKVYEEKN